MKNFAKGILSILFITFLLSAGVVLLLGTASWLFDMRFVTKQNRSELIDGDMSFNLLATAFLLFCAGAVWVLIDIKRVWGVVKSYPIISIISVGFIILVAIPVKQISDVYANGGPLPNAVTTRNHEQVKHLLATEEFDQEVLDRQLQRALNEGYLEIAATMIENGADIHWRSEHGTTLLDHATSFGKAESLQFLLEQGLDPNQISGSGSTPLSNLISNRQLHVRIPEDELEAQICEMVDLLLAAGADPTLGKSFGSNPIEAARRNGYDQVVQKLVSGQK